MPDTTPPDDVDPEVARRLTAAFGALATSEVPASAPRPGSAPRPPGRDAGHGRRRWGIAGGSLLVAAAAVVIALLVGSEVFDAKDTATVPPAGRSSSPAPDPAAVDAAFAAVAGDTRSPVVTVVGGYEGADLAAGTTIRFWTSVDGTTWTAAGTSVYPALAGTGADPASIKAAGLPTGATHALFVVDDQGATGDGSGVDVAYSDGPDGFGAVTAGPDGDLHPSGAGVAELGDTGTSYSADLADGQLVTVDCSETVALAVCGEPANQITKYWRWSGDAFVLDRRSGPAS